VSLYYYRQRLGKPPLRAATIEYPVKRFDPLPSDTPLELTVLVFPKGVPGLTKASPRPPTQAFHFPMYFALSSGLLNFGSP
jgi:hypothetical protein